MWTSRAAVALLSLLFLAAAPAADAAKRKPKPKPKTYHYMVAWTGLAEMSWEGETNEDIGGHTEGGFAMRFRGDIDDVVFRGTDVVKAGRPSSSSKLTGDTTETTWDRFAGTQDVNVCKGTDENVIDFGSSSFDNDLLAPLDGSAALVFRPFHDPHFDLPCSNGGNVTWQLNWVSPDGSEPELGQGVWDADFTLPREVLGMGKVIQRVKSRPNLKADCSIFLAGLNDVRECTAQWTMKLTFYKRKARH